MRRASYVVRRASYVVRRGSRVVGCGVVGHRSCFMARGSLVVFSAVLTVLKIYHLFYNITSSSFIQFSDDRTARATIFPLAAV